LKITKRWDVKWLGNNAAISCKDTNCTLAGSLDHYPILIKSNDSGNNWKFINKDNISKLPAFIGWINMSSTASI